MNMNTGISIEAIEISKTCDSGIIIDKCSYLFDKMAVYVIMGSNGAGKSTFLRMCSLLEKPDSGQIIYRQADSVLDHDISLRRRMTLVLPETGVFNSSVFDNAAYGLRIRNTPKSIIRESAMEILDFVGLKDRYNQRAVTLSTGEKKRLGIARAIAVKPEILFLDEPTASVDTENTRIIEKIILDLKSEKNTVIIMTTHDRSHAEKIADFLLRMENGRLLE